MSPAEFWQSTPYEVIEVVKARTEERRRMMASMLAPLLSCHSTRRITVDELLGPDSDELSLDDFSSVEEYQEAIEDRRAAKEGL